MRLIAQEALGNLEANEGGAPSLLPRGKVKTCCLGYLQDSARYQYDTTTSTKKTIVFSQRQPRCVMPITY